MGPIPVPIPVQQLLMSQDGGSASPSKLPLEFGSTIVTIPATSSRHEETGYATTLSPTMWYSSGKCNIGWQNGSSGALIILTYDERYGLTKPIRMYPPRDTYDVHHRPVLHTDNETLYMIVEQNHNDEPIDILKTRSPNDELTWQLTASKIGTATTYPHISKQGSIFVQIGQNDVSDEADTSFNINAAGTIEGTWTTEELVGTRLASPAGQVENEHYPSSLLNGDVITNRTPFVISGRTNAGIWFRKYLIRGDFQSGSKTYYNWSESFSKTSRLTAAELAANYMYYNTADNTKQGWTPVPASDANGNFYDVSGDGDGGLDFIYLAAAASIPVIKPLTLPGSPTLIDNGAQGGPCMLLIPVVTNSGTILYGIFRRVVGGFNKPYLYKSEDLSDSWTEIGDMLPGINKNIYSVTLPYNYNEIPNNKNFIIFFNSAADPTNTNLYIIRAAFGTIQTDDNANPYDDVTAYTESEYNALLARSYFIESGKITNTGTTLLTAIDQSPSAQDMTVVGTPQIDNATTPTKVTFNGTNQRGVIPITGLTTASEGMIIIVAKGVDGVTSHMVSAANTGNTNRWLGWGKGSNDVTRIVKNTSDFAIEGTTDVSDAMHIFVWLHQNGLGVGGTDVLHFLDGRLQDRVVTTGTSTTEGTFFDAIPLGLQNISIAALVRSGAPVFYGLEVKHVGIATSPMNYEQLRKSLKLLSNKFGITLQSGYN